MTLAQGGDRSAYDALLREIASLLRGFFGSRADCNEAAEDLVQETLVSIHRARHTYMPDRPFAPWMYAIARCRLADHWRKRARRVPQVALDEMTSAEGAVEEPADNVLNDRIRETLDGLPVGQRKVLQLLKLDGLSIKETARKLQMTEAAVKVAAHRAYERLRKKFNPHGKEDNENR